jgi:hypothetical protein
MMSDFDRYPGQGCRCGNDPSCNNCLSGYFYEEQVRYEEQQEQYQLELEQRHREEEMASLRPDDSCPECGCGYKYGERLGEIVEGWTGYCGHFDCGACSLLRAEKSRIHKHYKELRERYAQS